MELTRFPNISDLGQFPSVKTVIFDMDGTLLDTEGLHAQSISFVVEKFTGKVIKKELIEEDYLGMCDEDVYGHMIEKAILKSSLTVDDFLEEKNKALLLLISNAKECEYYFDEIKTFLKDLKNKNLTLAIVSASQNIIVDAFVKKLGLDEIMENTWGREDCEKSKPNPDPYLKAFEKLNVNAEDVLIFEDSPTGLMAAKSSGANVIKANWYS